MGASASGAGLGATGGASGMGYLSSARIYDICDGDNECIDIINTSLKGGSGHGGKIPSGTGLNSDECYDQASCTAAFAKLFKELGSAYPAAVETGAVKTKVEAKIDEIKKCAKNDSTEISKSNCFNGTMRGKVLDPEDKITLTNTDCSITYSFATGDTTGTFSTISIGDVQTSDVTATSYKIESVNSQIDTPVAKFENTDGKVNVQYYLVDNFFIDVFTYNAGNSLDKQGRCQIQSFE